MDRDRPEIYRALGRTIRVLRTDQGIDRKDLAERAGISYSYLAAIENGTKPPSSKVLFVIAEALGIRSHELLAAAETRQARPSPAARSRSWFHADAPPRPASAAGPAPRAMAADAMIAPDAAGETVERRAELPMERNVPRSPAGFLMEIERLTGGLSDEDRDLILEMARRLAGPR